MSSFTMQTSSAARFLATAVQPGKSGRGLSAALFPDVVYLEKLSESPDGDAGPAESFGAPGPPLACSVSAKRLERQAYAGGQEIGVTTVLISFPVDPGAAKGDRLLWLGRAIRLIAQARPEAGLGSSYLAQGEIRD